MSVASIIRQNLFPLSPLELRRLQKSTPRADGRLIGEHHAGDLKRESAEAKAQRIIAEELRRAPLDQRRPQTSPQKRSRQITNRRPPASRDHSHHQMDPPFARIKTS